MRHQNVTMLRVACRSKLAFALAGWASHTQTYQLCAMLCFGGECVLSHLSEQGDVFCNWGYCYIRSCILDLLKLQRRSRLRKDPLQPSLLGLIVSTCNMPAFDR